MVRFPWTILVFSLYLGLAVSDHCSVPHKHKGMVIDQEATNATGQVAVLEKENAFDVNDCNELCCDTDSCNVASFDDRDSLTDTFNCFLYSCVPIDRCVFQKHVHITSCEIVPGTFTTSSTTSSSSFPSTKSSSRTSTLSYTSGKTSGDVNKTITTQHSSTGDNQEPQNNEQTTSSSSSSLSTTTTNDGALKVINDTEETIVINEPKPIALTTSSTKPPTTVSVKTQKTTQTNKVFTNQTELSKITTESSHKNSSPKEESSTTESATNESITSEIDTTQTPVSSDKSITAGSTTKSSTISKSFTSTRNSTIAENSSPTESSTSESSTIDTTEKFSTVTEKTSTTLRNATTVSNKVLVTEATDQSENNRTSLSAATNSTKGLETTTAHDITENIVLQNVSGTAKALSSPSPSVRLSTESLDSSSDSSLANASDHRNSPSTASQPTSTGLNSTVPTIWTSGSSNTPQSSSPHSNLVGSSSTKHLLASTISITKSLVDNPLQNSTTSLANILNTNSSLSTLTTMVPLTDEILQATTDKNESYTSPGKQTYMFTTSNGNMVSAALVAALSFGVLFFFAVMFLVGKRCYDSWQRRHYSRIDYLINGMYN